MHLKEVSHGTGLFGLLNLECGEEIDEPLEALLISVDPEKIYLPQVQHGLHVLTPLMVTSWALSFHLPISVHDGLQIDVAPFQQADK